MATGIDPGKDHVSGRRRVTREVRERCLAVRGDRMERPPAVTRRAGQQRRPTKAAAG